MIRFYDTNALLDLKQDIFSIEKDYDIYISNVSLFELENIKNSISKDEETKWSAREVIRLLIAHKGDYNIIIYNDNLKHHLYDIDYGDLPNTPDTKIILCALEAQCKDRDFIFITRDSNCMAIAESVGLKTEYPIGIDDKDNYVGFKEVHLSEEQLAEFYNDFLVNNINEADLLINEYLLIYFYNELVDKYKWTKEGYKKIDFQKEESSMFGKIVPKDAYQQIAMDSLNNNQITMLRGPAGTGKSYIAFGHLFKLLEQGKIDKIIVFCNTVATKGSARLGYYPGSRTEKLLDSQIGNLLESKLGDRAEVERLIDERQLLLLPMSDIRGYDTTGMNAGIYISEAQNLDIELMRLALQRIGEDSICIIDGDARHQVDMSIYAGSNNGMKRVSKVFKGQDFYGEIELKNIYRSRIAKQAELL